MPRSAAPVALVPIVLSCLLAVHACGDEPDAGGKDAGAAGDDAGLADAGPADAGEAPDASVDAGEDAGPGVDAGPADGGPDAGDAGPADGGADAGPADGGSVPAKRPFGDVCTRGTQCESNICTQAGICTRTCDAEHPCPAAPEWSCSDRWHICRCTPTGEDLPGNGRDEDCDGVADQARASRCTTAPYLLDCGTCVDPQTNPYHCGGCNRPCRSGTCTGGVCAAWCTTPPLDLECDGQCVNKLTNPAHCGACNHECRSGVCTDGVCAPKPCTVQSDCGLDLDQFCLAGWCEEALGFSMRTLYVDITQVLARSPRSIRFAAFHRTSPDGSTVDCASLAPGAIAQASRYNLALTPSTFNVPSGGNVVVTGVQVDGSTERYVGVEAYDLNAGAGNLVGWGCSPVGSATSLAVTIAPRP